MLLCTLGRFSTFRGIYLQRCRQIYTLRNETDKILLTKSRFQHFKVQNQPSSATWWSAALQFCRPESSKASSDKYDIHNPFATDLKEEETSVEDEKFKPVGYWSSLFQVWRTPMPALLTGLAGLAPFLAAPWYLYFFSTSFHPFMISAQLAYAAVILSFVGGIRWGFVLPYRHGSTHMVTWRAILQSIVPPVIAWGGVLLPDLTGGLVTVSAGLAIALYNDLRLFGDYPKWMMGLRCLLTTVAIVTLIASVILVEENRMKNTFGKRIQNKLLDKEIS